VRAVDQCDALRASHHRAGRFLAPPLTGILTRLAGRGVGDDGVRDGGVAGCIAVPAVHDGTILLGPAPILRAIRQDGG
jgi:hypothetical protein